MKTRYIAALGALASTLALVPPCTADANSPQLQTNLPPTRVVWDGSEYAGQLNGQFYYYGPNNSWLPMDNTRQQRFNQWQNNQAAGSPGEQSSPSETTHSQGQKSSGQQNQTGNSASGQNVMEHPGQNGNAGHQGH